MPGCLVSEGTWRWHLAASRTSGHRSAEAAEQPKQQNKGPWAVSILGLVLSAGEIREAINVPRRHQTGNAADQIKTHHLSIKQLCLIKPAQESGPTYSLVFT